MFYHCHLVLKNEKAYELSLADSTGAIKCVAYDNICKPFHSGDVISMRQYERGFTGILMANKNTRVHPSLSLKSPISDEIMAVALNIVDPDDTMISLHMPKELAQQIWSTTTSTGIKQRLRDNKSSHLLSKQRT